MENAWCLFLGLWMIYAVIYYEYRLRILENEHMEWYRRVYGLGDAFKACTGSFEKLTISLNRLGQSYKQEEAKPITVDTILHAFQEMKMPERKVVVLSLVGFERLKDKIHYKAGVGYSDLSAYSLDGIDCFVSMKLMPDEFCVMTEKEYLKHKENNDL